MWILQGYRPVVFSPCCGPIWLVSRAVLAPYEELRTVPSSFILGSVWKGSVFILLSTFGRIATEATTWSLTSPCWQVLITDPISLLIIGPFRFSI